MLYLNCTCLGACTWLFYAGVHKLRTAHVCVHLPEKAMLVGGMPVIKHGHSTFDRSVGCLHKPTIQLKVVDRS